MKSMIFLLFTIAMSIGLVSYGSFLLFNDKISDGLTLLSLGVITILILTILTSIGKAIDIFSKIFEKQMDIQEKIINHQSKSSANPLSSFFPNGLISPENSSITITNLQTGESETKNLSEGADSMSNFTNMILNSMNQFNNKFNSNQEPTLKELESDLQKAVKIEDFEKAKEIRDKIKKIKEDNQKDNQDED
jgi:hypothetical protein